MAAVYSQNPHLIAVAVGTRPEAIKLLPVVLALRSAPDLAVRLIATGQHRELADSVFEVFGIAPDVNLNLMTPDQTLAEAFSRTLKEMTNELEEHRPAFLLVEGDTTTVFASTLAAFWLDCPVGHVEAGLRSGDKRNPFPEEANRILTGHLADFHFAPTRKAADNLHREGIDPDRVLVTGNTVIDALLAVAAEVDGLPPSIPLSGDRRVLLATVHRRESFGRPLREIFTAFRDLARRFEDVEIVLPVHPNPRVRETAYALLDGTPRIHLVDPLDYPGFVWVMKNAYLVLTDSGGVQEEAPALGKPVLVLRETTERPEGIAAGVARLVGTERERIVRAASRLLEDETEYSRFARRANPYGDGEASQRIVEAVRYRLGLRENRPEEFNPEDYV